MQLRSEVKSDLDSLAKAIANVEGVVAVILFGSRARGDYDEYSDYDILVVFHDDEVMWKNRRRIYQNVGKLGLFTQVLTRSIKELKEKTEPTFLQNVLQHGILLFLRYPFKTPALTKNLKPMAIVTYSLKELQHKEKMKVAYRLFGKKTKEGNKGIVQQNEGTKLGDGCLMIPIENLDTVIQVLKQFNAQFETMKVYASPLISP